MCQQGLMFPSGKDPLPQILREVFWILEFSSFGNICLPSVRYLQDARRCPIDPASCPDDKIAFCLSLNLSSVEWDIWI